LCRSEVYWIPFSGMQRIVTHPVGFDSSIVGACWLVYFWKDIPDRQPDLDCVANVAKMTLTDDTWVHHSLPRFHSLAKPPEFTSPRFACMPLTAADDAWRGLCDCFPCRKGWEVCFCLGNRALQSLLRGPWALTVCGRMDKPRLGAHNFHSEHHPTARMEEPVVPRCQVSDAMRSSPAQASTLNRKST
jgi:hypothetical protein